MKAHPAAEVFPLLPDAALESLAEDIARNGLRFPIVTYGGMVLDGRNRERACERVGVVPQYRELSQDTDPYAYVWSTNGERRDLEQGQKGAIRLRIRQGSADWVTERDYAHEEANRKRSAAAKGNKNAAKDREDSRLSRDKRLSKPDPTNHAHKRLAKEVGISETTAARVLALSNKAPDLFEKVADGELSLPAATREAQRRETIVSLESTAAQEAKAIEGVYDVVVIDPPWQMQKIERDERPNQVEFDYPRMTEAELADLEVPCAADAHVWVWATHKHLPVAFRLLDSWGLKYVCTFVWHKPGGFQPVGLPQYNCEFVIYARKGSPQFIDTKALPACFDAPRGRHSEKPEEFYATVRRVTAGRRIDMFGRRKIEGFDSWGKEAPDAA